MPNLKTVQPDTVGQSGLDRQTTFKPTKLKLRIMRIWKRDKYLLLMCIPGIALTVAFKYFPIYGLIMAFERFNPAKGFFASEWVGLHYFKQFFEDPFTFRIIKNTFLLGIYVILWTFPAPIILALMLNELRVQWFKRIVQTISYFPFFISVVIVVGLMLEMLSPVDGIINDLLAWMGFEKINFFSEAEWFRTLYISSTLWQSTGFASIIYLAAMAGIDPELYEAATVDGANRWHKLKFITLPGIMPTAVVLLILSVGGIVSYDFVKVLLMYNPGTYETSDIIGTYIYRMGLENSNYSYSAAVGLLTSVVAFVFVWGTNYISKKTSDTSVW